MELLVDEVTGPMKWVIKRNVMMNKEAVTLCEGFPDKCFFREKDFRKTEADFV